MFDHRVTIFTKIKRSINKKIVKPIRSWVEDHQDLILWILMFILMGFAQD